MADGKKGIVQKAAEVRGYRAILIMGLLLWAWPYVQEILSYYHVTLNIPTGPIMTLLGGAFVLARKYTGTKVNRDDFSNPWSQDNT